MLLMDIGRGLFTIASVVKKKELSGVPIFFVTMTGNFCVIITIID